MCVYLRGEISQQILISCRYTVHKGLLSDGAGRKGGWEGVYLRPPRGGGGGDFLRRIVLRFPAKSDSSEKKINIR